MTDNNQTENDNFKDESGTSEEVQDWRVKLNDLVNTCQTELKKTTKIGMRMISASQANAELQEIYQVLGKWLVEESNNGVLKVDDAEVRDLVAKVKTLESQLEGFEQDVQDIKKE